MKRLILLYILSLGISLGQPISRLPELLERPASNDAVAILDVSQGITKKVQASLFNPNNSINVASFGAVCDGVADDTIALQTAFTTLQNTAQTLIITGTCSITSTVTATDDLHISGGGNIKCNNASGRCIVIKGSGPSGVSTTVNETITFANRHTATELTVTLTSAPASFAVGDWLRFDFTDGSHNYKQNAKIQAISGLDFTFVQPIKIPLTAGVTTVEEYSFIDDVSVENLTFNGSEGTASGLLIQYALYPRTSNLYFHDFTSDAYHISGGQGGSSFQTTVVDSATDGSAVYVISDQGEFSVNGLQVLNSDDYGFGPQCNQCTGGNWNDVYVAGVASRGIKITNANNMQFSNISIQGSGRLSSNNCFGIVGGSYNNKIFNMDLNSCGDYGIWLVGDESDYNTGYGISIKGTTNHSVLMLPTDNNNTFEVAHLGPGASISTVFDTGTDNKIIWQESILFANLDTVNIGNGSRAHLIDGTEGTDPCVGGGNGTWAERVNGRWLCGASGVGGGEVNTMSNLGAGTGIFSTKVGVDLRLKSLLAGTGMDSFTTTANDITINALLSPTGTNTFTGVIDGSGTSAFRIRGGSGAPGAGECTSGAVAAVYVDTDNGGSKYHCLQTGAGVYTWVANSTGGGAPTTATYWTASADATLSAEVVVNDEATLESAVGSLNILIAPEIDTSAELRALVTDEQGTGSLVFNGSPQFIDVIINDLITFIETAGDATCGAGDYWIKGNSSTGVLRGCENGSLFNINTAAGATAWDSLTAPTGAVLMTSNGTSETATFDFQAAFTTGCQFCVISSTGNPSGGTLFRVQGHDTDPLLAQIWDGTNGIQVSGAGAMTSVGSGSIAASTGISGFTVTSPVISTSLGQDGDAADSGFGRFQNNAQLCWEASPAGTDVCIEFDASEIFQVDGTLNAGTITGANVTSGANPGHTHTGSSLSGIDISDDTNLVAGADLTLTDDTLSVDDSYLRNNGDVGTGIYDLGGATSFELPNGAPTVNATGEIGIDDTDEQIIIGANGRVAAQPYKTMCMSIENLAAADDDMYFFNPGYNITVVDSWCHCKGTCTTEADLSWEYRQVGTASTVTDVTGTVDCEDEVTGDSKTTLSGNVAIPSLDILRFDVDNAVSPETDTYIMCIGYRIDPT